MVGFFLTAPYSTTGVTEVLGKSNAEKLLREEMLGVYFWMT